MVLADCLDGAPFEVLGTDISTRVLQDAVRGLYPMSRGRHLPPALRQRCAPPCQARLQTP